MRNYYFFRSGPTLFCLVSTHFVLAIIKHLALQAETLQRGAVDGDP